MCILYIIILIDYYFLHDCNILTFIFGQFAGLILRIGTLNNLETDDLYEDEGYWKIEEEEERNSPVMVEAKKIVAA